MARKNADWLANYSETDFVFPDAYEEVIYENELQSIVAVTVIIFALLGILLNIIVIILSYGNVKGDFRHFVANLALVDIACGFVFAFMGYINIDDMSKQFSFSIMSYVPFIFYGSFGIMIWALVPISMSRVFALTKPNIYSTIFSGRRSLLFCALSDLLPVLVLYMVATADHNVARWLLYLYAFLIGAAYLIAFVSNYMVFRIVSRHISVVQNLRDQARLIETRQISLATLAQALVPLVCQVPAFLTLSSVILLTDSITNGTVTIITQLWLASSPLLDAIITILVIKQYRKEAFGCVSSISQKVVSQKKKSNVLYSEEQEPFETRL